MSDVWLFLLCWLAFSLSLSETFWISNIVENPINRADPISPLTLFVVKSKPNPEAYLGSSSAIVLSLFSSFYDSVSILIDSGSTRKNVIPTIVPPPNIAISSITSGDEFMKEGA